MSVARTVFGGEDQEEILRRNLSTLVSSYADEADVFVEMIQNAVDAIRRSPGETTGLHVILSRGIAGQRDYVAVVDNGTGMPPDTFAKVAVPGFSDKAQGQDLGYKGVGASYFFAAANHIAVKTMDAGGKLSQRTVKNAYSWITTINEEITVSNDFIVSDAVAKAAGDMQRGTAVYFEFHAEHDPASLDYQVLRGSSRQEELHNWMGYLAAKTALGQVGSANSATEFVRDFPVTITLIASGERVSGTYQPGAFKKAHQFGYPYPNRILGVGKDTQDAVPADDNALPAVWHRWTADELLDDLLGTSEGHQDTRDQLSGRLEFAYGYFCHSSDVFEELRRQLGTRAQQVRYGIRLAVDGIPQGRRIDLRLTSSIGHERQMHIVIGLSAAHLDTGRKILADEALHEAVTRLGTRIATELRKSIRYLKREFKDPDAANLEAWADTIEDRRGTSTAAKLFDDLGSPDLLCVDPHDENEVIALWTALCATGVVKGYRTKAISGFNRYDSLIDILPAAAQVDSGDPLAPSTSLVQGNAKDNAVLEFKTDFVGLVEDFDNRRKRPDEIDLVVCWDATRFSSKYGTLRPCFGEESDNRPLHSVTYSFDSASSATTAFNVISLRAVLAEVLHHRGVDSAPLSAVEADAKTRSV